MENIKWLSSPQQIATVRIVFLPGAAPNNPPPGAGAAGAPKNPPAAGAAAGAGAPKLNAIVDRFGYRD